MKTIFVSVASYRDADVQNTVDDLFAKAHHPSRIFVGVYLQNDPELDTECTVKLRENVRITAVDTKYAKGASWARSKVQALWDGEDYFFQVDSHMRFATGWDTILIDMLAQCPSDNPVISTYPLPFTPPATFNEDRYVTIKPKKFDVDGVLLQTSGMVPFLPDQPLVKTPFIAAGLLFGSSSIITDVPADEYIFFTGEEITMGLRLFTHGYDVYVPNKVIAYHNYNLAPERPRIWVDVGDSTTRSSQSRSRVLWLCGTRDAVANECLIDIDKYGLGKKRTLGEFEEFSGIDFKQQLYNGEKP